MESALRIKTKVLPGKKIEITSPDLVEGDSVEVLVVLPAKSAKRRRSVLDLLKSTPAPGVFKTAAEVDKYLQEERDSWDR